jgi:hypothetical protein
MTELTAKYRTVFGGALGQEVLADILSMTHFGNTLNPENQAQIAEYNVGIAILAKMGIFSIGTKNQVVKALGAVTPNEKKEDLK